MLTMTKALASHRGQSPASALEAGVRDVVARSRQAWTRYRTYRRTLSELRALPLDSLLDLNLARGDLKGVARRATCAHRPGGGLPSRTVATRKEPDMAHALTTYHLEGREHGALARLRQAAADYLRYRRTYAELNALDDRELYDLGLSRHSVRDVARASVWGN
jgi:uncharacterized protein YjiS (DUF1127 family)